MLYANTEKFPFDLVSESELCELLDVDLPSQVDYPPSLMNYKSYPNNLIYLI